MKRMEIPGSAIGRGRCFVKRGSVFHGTGAGREIPVAKKSVMGDKRDPKKHGLGGTNPVRSRTTTIGKPEP